MFGYYAHTNTANTAQKFNTVFQNLAKNYIIVGDF